MLYNIKDGHSNEIGK